MSACISPLGEYSEHEFPDAMALDSGEGRWTCDRCGEFNHEGLIAEVERLQAQREAALAAVQEMLDGNIVTGGWIYYGERIRAALGYST